MVDMKKYYSDINDSGRPLVSDTAPEKPWVTDCACVVCRRRKEEAAQSEAKPEIFGDYHRIVPETHEFLEAHQYFLLPPRLWAFVFKTRTWGKLCINIVCEILI